jgi:hypothetical protein
MPASLAPIFTASRVNEGDKLMAADQANWFYQLWTQGVVNVNAAKQVYVAGSFAFEWRDEWWKANPRIYFHSITGNDTCGKALVDPAHPEKGYLPACPCPPRRVNRWDQPCLSRWLG